MIPPATVQIGGRGERLTVMRAPKIMGLSKLDPTAWLKMVWNALDERDPLKRKRMLENANTFRREDSRESCSPQQDSSPSLAMPQHAE
jgi:hypothetical protein